MVDQDVINRLDNALLSLDRPRPRVDTAAMPTGFLKDLTIQFERRAKIVVRRISAEFLSRKRPATHVFFCEDPNYGALALHDRHDYIVLHVGIIPTVLDFCVRMMATPGLWPNR